MTDTSTFPIRVAAISAAALIASCTPQSDGKTLDIMPTAEGYADAPE